MLLLSGAIPASPARLNWIERVLPLAVVEGSHFIGSVAGAVLLVLSQGLSRRLAGAYYFAVLTIVAGTGASILKGLDFEEAVLFVGVLLVLRRARPAFYRRAGFLDTRPSPERIARLSPRARPSCSGCSPIAGLRARLWWPFAFGADASAFLRASGGRRAGLRVARLVASARTRRAAREASSTPGK